ncbi:MAG: 30S ribosomal protein S13, partial [Candidatus Micrarchaeota archaeon]|nr:30S ribosomal protein S13 [Candidatus Micrarchaeota archaeon]
DFMDGTDKHVIMNDLIFAGKQDTEKEKRIFSWNGFRHYYGQKVRGQRTRNTGRTGMAVGVLRKSIIAAAAPAAGTAGKPGASAPAGGAAPAAGVAKGPAPAGGAAKPAVAAKPAAKPEAKK